MNVNDVICVGAEPLAMLDYIAVERADPDGLRADRRSAWRAAPSWPGSRSPAASSPSSASWSAASTSRAPASAPSRSTRSSTGAAVEPGDAVIGLPSSGTPLQRLHPGPLRRSTGSPSTTSRLGRPLGDVLLEPTEIYVRPVLELLRSEVDVRGLAHITSGGLGNLLRLAAEVGYEIDDPLPVPPIFELIQERGEVADEEMHEVFNMGCGFCVVVAAADEDAALDLLRRHYPEAKRIGRAIGALGEGLAGLERETPWTVSIRSVDGSRCSWNDGHRPNTRRCRPISWHDDRHRALRPLPAGGEAGQRRDVDRLPGARRDARPRRSRSR